MKAQHAIPTPLLVHVTDGGAVYITDNHEFSEASFVIRADQFGDGPHEANAAHIVHCVNTHEQLVAALEVAVDRIEYFEKRHPDLNMGGLATAYKQARAALAAAKK